MTISAKSEAAYQRALAAKDAAHAQGMAGKPMSGDPLLFSTISDDHIALGVGKNNAFREAFERGVLSSKTDTSGASNG